MKKTIIGFLCGLIIGAIGIALVINFSSELKDEELNSTTKNTTTESTSKNKKTKSTSNNEEKETETKNEGYEIKVSKTDIIIEKGSKASFDITYTNPDETSIREYIDCKDQDDIVAVTYSDIVNKKINVEVEALKVGTTEISISDYSYPNKKVTVKVNIIEKNK